MRMVLAGFATWGGVEEVMSCERQGGVFAEFLCPGNCLDCPPNLHKEPQPTSLEILLI